MRRREIFIELTSLLDVILIMLFVLLTQAKTQTDAAVSSRAEAEAAAENVRAELSQTQEERDALAGRLETLEREGISVSYGSAFADETDDAGFKALMDAADKNMYEQKKHIHELNRSDEA